MFMDYKTLATLQLTVLQRLAEQVGNTPLQSISLLIDGYERKIHLKLEGENPTGSMKDRTGYALIQHQEKLGKLHSGSIIVESTSGNLGVALALQCKAKGYRFIAVIDPKTTQENIVKMQTLGAQLELVDQADATGGYLLTRLARIQALCADDPNCIWTCQYASQANPYIHYSSTGPEIYRQMDGHVDAVLIPVSTGGTLAGVGRFFREVSPSTRIIGVDAYGSVVFGTPPAPRKLTGIGSSQPSNFITTQLYDDYILVNDIDAFAYCHALQTKTNLKVGGSSGATLAACTRYLAAHPELRRVVCLCADRGENYASSIFNAEWICQQHLDISQAVRDALCHISAETALVATISS